MKLEKKIKGFTLIELLISLAIMGLLTAIIINSLYDFRRKQALLRDTETVVESLNQARNQTISSKNLSVYGVHFASSTVTVFTGSSYDPATTTNNVYTLNAADIVLSVNLSGGDYDVIFERLTGETMNEGTVVISSPGLSQTKTVTIHRTGVIESQ